MDLVEDYVKGGGSMQRRDAKDIIEEFNNELSKIHGKCIDIGCGPGDITKELLLPVLPHDAEVVGVDLSDSMVNYARKNNSDKRLSYVVLDIEASDLPNEMGQYDLAVSFMCLHWCNDMWRVFENIYKLLRPNGKALVMFLGHHHGFNSYVKLKQNPRYESYLKDAHRYIPYFQREENRCKEGDGRAGLRKMLEDMNFAVLHCSKREKSFQYSKQSLKKHVYAVSPFVNRFPDDIKGEFMDHLISEISQNALIPINSKDNEDDCIVLRYDLLIAYVQKLSPTEKKM